jgi:glycosyltransferase involved in cell wall biosynthesis
VRLKYQLPERVILYLGGFDVRKNVGRVIQAFAALEAERSNGWKLVMAGKLPMQDVPYFPDPRRMAAESGVPGDVQFLGFVAEQDKPALYASARLVVFPSHYEGFGLPPLEAMACGTPVICSNTSSLPEVAGEAGILCEPDDTRGWVEALRAMLGDDRRWQERRAVGLKQARRFSWERTARETLAVYRTVV